jgi:hypothetical protein
VYCHGSAASTVLIPSVEIYPDRGQGGGQGGPGGGPIRSFVPRN